jgi:hypothetical protein
MVPHVDPSPTIRDFARPHGACSSLVVSTSDIEQQRKSRGMCIVCGQAATHEKKGRFGFGGWKPLNKNKVCYKQNMCPACYRRKFVVKRYSTASKEGTEKTAEPSSCFFHDSDSSFLLSPSTSINTASSPLRGNRHSMTVKRPVSCGVPSFDDCQSALRSRGSPPRDSDQKKSVGGSHATNRSQGSRMSTASTRSSGSPATDKRSSSRSSSYFSGVPSFDHSDPSFHSSETESGRESGGSAISRSTVGTRQSVATHANNNRSQGSRVSTASTRSSGPQARDFLRRQAKV